MRADISADQLSSEASHYINRDELFTKADAESYEIGFVAGLILDRQGVDWKTNFYQENLRAEEKILETVEVIVDEIDPELDAKISAEIDTYNQSIENDIQDIIRTKQDKSIPCLKIDISNSTSSMFATSVIRYNDDMITVNYGNLFTIDGKTIEIKQFSVLDRFGDDWSHYIYVPLTMPFEIQADLLRVESDQLKVNNVQFETLQEDGRTVYAVIADGEPNDSFLSFQYETPELLDEARLQDDFYTHVNRDIINHKLQSGNKYGWDQLSEINNRTNDNLQKIADDLLEKIASFEAGSTEKVVADLYMTASDIETRDSVGLGSLAPYIESIQSANSIDSYLEALATIRKDLGHSSLIITSASPDPSPTPLNTRCTSKSQA